MTEINWKNLKTLNCPKCEEDLIRGENNRQMFWCSNKTCDFIISENRLRDVVNKMCSDEKDYGGWADFEELMDASE